jgi:hypothetical protein
MHISIPQYTGKLYCLVHRGERVSQLIVSIEQCVPEVPTTMLLCTMAAVGLGAS